jgi:hypothetical protein
MGVVIRTVEEGRQHSDGPEDGIPEDGGPKSSITDSEGTNSHHSRYSERFASLHDYDEPDDDNEYLDVVLNPIAAEYRGEVECTDDSSSEWESASLSSQPASEDSSTGTSSPTSIHRWPEDDIRLLPKALADVRRLLRVYRDSGFKSRCIRKDFEFSFESLPDYLYSVLGESELAERMFLKHIREIMAAAAEMKRRRSRPKQNHQRHLHPYSLLQRLHIWSNCPYYPCNPDTPRVLEAPSWHHDCQKWYHAHFCHPKAKPLQLNGIIFDFFSLSRWILGWTSVLWGSKSPE